MRFFKKCEVCKHRSFIIKQRSYNFKHLPNVGKIKSEADICLKCKINVILMIMPDSKKLIVKLYKLWKILKKR